MAQLSRWLGRLFAGAAHRSAFQRYLLAVILPIAAFGMTLAFARVAYAPFFPLFSLAVVVAAVFGGIRPGLTSVTFSVALSLASIFPPFSPDIPDSNDFVRVFAFAIVSGVIAILIGSAGELQHKLDVERRRLDVTLRSIGDAVIATDAKGRITFMNKVAEDATGYSLEEASGRLLPEVFNIVNERTRERVENPVAKVLGSGRIVGLANHTILIRRNGSEVPIDDSAAPIVNDGALIGVILVFRDITESKLAEAALLRAEKLASVGRLAATIAHEVNNPLESVTNLIYLIGSSDDQEKIKQFAEAAQVELARAAHVTRQTLSFARPTAARESASLPQLVDGIVALYETRLQGKGVALVRRYRGEGVALATRSEVRQVISNLLGNAIDAEKKGGRIDIRVSSPKGTNFIRLTVADRGCGMTPEQQENMFEAFFTTKEDIGTGLGLWVTKQIVDAHGGTIRVRSRLGRGSVFAVTWPALQPQASEAAVSRE